MSFLYILIFQNYTQLCALARGRRPRLIDQHVTIKPLCGAIMYTYAELSLFTSSMSNEKISCSVKAKKFTRNPHFVLPRSLANRPDLAHHDI